MVAPIFLANFFFRVIGEMVEEGMSKEEAATRLKARYPSFTWDTFDWIFREEVLRQALAYDCTRAMTRLRTLSGVFPLDPERDPDSSKAIPWEVYHAEETCAFVQPYIADVPVLGKYVRLVRWAVPRQALLLKLRVRRLRGLPYEQYLQTTYWAGVRWLAHYRAAWRCQLCNGPRWKATLHVHHRTYEHLGEETQYPRDVIVLCKECHEHFHFPEGPGGTLRRVYH